MSKNEPQRSYAQETNAFSILLRNLENFGPLRSAPGLRRIKRAIENEIERISEEIA